MIEVETAATRTPSLQLRMQWEEAHPWITRYLGMGELYPPVLPEPGIRAIDWIADDLAQSSG